MPDFQGGPNYSTPFGRNVWMRSTRVLQFEHYTFAKAAIPAVTIDGFTGQKVLQPGTIIAKITSGDDAGKVGVFDRGAAGGNNEVQKVTVATSGNTTLGFQGVNAAATSIAADSGGLATALALLEGLPDIWPGDVTGEVGSGGDAGKLIFTFGGRWAGLDVPSLTATGTGASVATSTAGGAGTGAATDGRGDFANIVGVCNTFLPWQLMHRDVEIAVVYHATGVQAWCIEYMNSVKSTLSNRTADALRGTKGLDLLFK